MARPTRTSEDSRLDALLAALPRVRAAPSFGAEVARRIARRRERSARARRLALAAGTALALGLAAWAWTVDSERRAAHRELLALRAEVAALRGELADLERLRSAARPIVHLGSTDRVDLVLDLERLAATGRRDGARPERRPALLEPARRQPTATTRSNGGNS